MQDGTLILKIESSGHVRSIELKDGIPNGKFTVVDQNGRTIQEGTYAEGYREGTWRDWTYTDGAISSESIETYKDGLLDGYRVGAPIVYGLLDSVQNSDFNVVKIREFYVAGELHGLRIGFDDEGNTVIREHYEYGRIKMFEEIDFDTGITRQIVQFKDGKEHGVKLLFHEDGRLEEFTELRKGKENGVRYQFSGRGHLKRISNRKDDLFHGDDWSFKKTGIASSRSIIDDHENPEDWDFHDDGSVSEHSTYKKSGKLRSRKIFNQKGEDVSNGKWEYFDEKGRLKVSGEYENGFAQGRWEYFDKKGRLRSSGIAKGGRKHGMWTEYSKKGKRTAIEIWENGKYLRHYEQ